MCLVLAFGLTLLVHGTNRRSLKYPYINIDVRAFVYRMFTLFD